MLQSPISKETHQKVLNYLANFKFNNKKKNNFFNFKTGI